MTASTPEPTAARPIRSPRAVLGLGVVAAVATLLTWPLWRPAVWPAQPPAAVQAPPPRPVETVPLAEGTGIRSVLLIGQVESSQQATIRAQTSGIVQDIRVQPGDRITPGALLAVLDDTDQKLALARAQAQLAEARSQLARLEAGTRREIIARRQAELRSAQAREKEASDNLKRASESVRKGAITERALVEAKAAVDDAAGTRASAEAALAEAEAGPLPEEIAAQRANVAAAQAAVHQAQLAVERTRIKAQSSAVVQTRLVSQGDYVQINAPIVTLIASDRLEVFLALPEDLSGRILPGMPVELSARALPNWRQSLPITGVIPAADAASRRQLIRIELDPAPPGLLAGMAVAGKLDIPLNTPAFVISRDALTLRRDQWFVFAVADGKARQTQVQLVADMGETVAIYNDALRPGQDIVVRGGDGLRDGAAVKIVGNAP
ncbi:MAG TPA: efflux RND transporter periplasmic adaptor subunit [Candidatus Contendobacter sp.]|nr:efflux RND transporter periplasmic adaptor subunit [Candidatus Contendobacter sp.]